MMQRIIGVVLFFWLLTAFAVDNRLDLQSKLDAHVPLNQATFLGTHNSFNSKAYRYWPYIFRYSFPNHDLSVYQQLEAGARSIEFDVHWADHSSGGRTFKEAVLCHGRSNNIGCWLTDRLLTEGLAEVKKWLSENPDEVVMMYVQREFDQKPSATIARQINNSMGKYLLSAQEIKQYQAAPEVCSDLPQGLTKAKVLALARKKGVRSQLVILSKGCLSEAHAWNNISFIGMAGFSQTPEDTKVGGFEGVSKDDMPSVDVYPLCAKDRAFKADPNHKSFWRVFEDRAFLDRIVDPSKLIREQDMRYVVKCGVNWPNVDMLQSDDARFLAAIWSWAPGYPQEAGDYALFDSAVDGLVNSSNVAQRLPAACLDFRDYSWHLSQPTSFENAALACQVANEHYHFALPASGLSMQKIKAIAAEHASVWVNYQKINHQWQAANLGLVWRVGYPDEGEWQIARNDYKACATWHFEQDDLGAGLININCKQSLPVLCRDHQQWSVASGQSGLDLDSACTSGTVSVPVTAHEREQVNSLLAEQGIADVWVNVHRNEQGLWRVD